MIRRKCDCTVSSKNEMRGGKGEVFFRALADKDELLQHARLFSIITLAPGCSIGYHKHENETEYFYCLSGTPTINDNGTESLLQPGDIAITPDGCSHSLTNNTDAPCEVLALIIME